MAQIYEQQQGIENELAKLDASMKNNEGNERRKSE